MWSPRDPGHRTLAIRAAFCAALVAAGCASSRLEVPAMGPLLPYAARLELSPSVTTPVYQYTDDCGHIQEIRFGALLEETLTEATYRTFQAVITGTSKTKEPFPEIVVRVELVHQKLELKQDNVYDRVPAYLQLSALAKFYDASGKLLRESDIKVDRNERLLIRHEWKDCTYLIDSFLQDTAVEFASQYMQEARAAVGSGSRTAAAAPASGNAAAPAAPLAQKPGQPGSNQVLAPIVPPIASSASSLRFKATVLDENGNLVFEGGERIRVRVDLVNTGDQELQGVTASLSGTPVLLAQFPVSTLAVGRLQPGQSRSIEFVATLPQAVQSQKAEIQVTVSDPGAGTAPPPQTMALLIQPTGVKTDDVDQIPAVADGFHRPHTYLISIGIGSYRDQRISTRKFASLDAEMVSSYFQSLGGLPAANVRLLQDWKALRPDIDEALLDWLPPHMNKDAIVIVYFAGVAMVSSTGETFLVPYEGSAATTSRLYPLKDLEAGLARLRARQTVFIFDGLVSRLGPETKAKTTNPQWGAGGTSTIFLISPTGLGNGLEDERHRHGLFTYYLLRALRGDADTNRDGEVTIGEVIPFLSQKVAWAARARFNREQRVLIVPSLSPSDKAAELILTKLAALQGAEVR
jgi:Caspase domain